MKVIKIDEQGLYDILNGSTLLASGGGGAKENGMQLVKQILADEKWKGYVECAILDGIEDDENVGVVCAPASPIAITKYGFGKSPVRSFNLLEELFQTKNPFTKNGDKDFKYNYVIPIETGVVPHLMSLQIAVKKEIKVLNGDGAGRAFPKITMNTFSMAGIPVGPFSLVTEKSVEEGGVDMIVNLTNPAEVDDIMRNVISTDSYNNVSSSTCFTMNGKTAKTSGAILEGTITKAMKIGELLRKTEENKIEALLEFLEKENGFAKILFEGQVKSIEQKTQGGFDIGILKIASSTEEIDIMNQNENMIVWSNKKNCPLAMAPDLVCFVDRDGNAYSTPDLKEGQEIVVLGISSLEEYNKEYIREKYLEVFRDFNYYGSYVSIKDID